MSAQSDGGPAWIPEPWRVVGREVMEDGSITPVELRNLDDFVPAYMEASIIPDMAKKYPNERAWSDERALINGARIVACVNACEGITDPADFIARAKAAGVTP